MKTRLAAILSLWLLGCGAAAAEAIDAAALYRDHCSVCHGEGGDGNSHARQGMTPPPRDFTSPQSTQELTRERILHAIREGVPGTAMSGWKSRLGEAQITALAAWIKSRFISPVASARPTPGAEIYAAYCSVCHGDNGRGAIWASAGLSPRPADFTNPDFQASMTRDHMIQSVSYGRPETAMTGWKQRLSETQIASVVDYVIDSFMPELQQPGGAEVHVHSDGHSHVHADPALELSAYLQQSLAGGLVGDAARGGALYRSNCATCHGDDGDGRGPRAYFINPKPRNFLHAASRAALNRPALYRVIARGKLRTEMPAWEKVLDAQQIADLSEYVFVQFIQPR